MQANLKVNAATIRRRRRNRFGAVGSLARASEPLVAARLRRLSIQAGKNRTGLTALFTGASGTGKSMVSTLAKSLGKNIYRIDLSTLPENYIGETEKNLSRLLAEARRQNAVLFFDEADALFGKRSEVTDSHDRYANQEVSYLLARIASYRGIIILSTNRRTEIDSVIARRFDAVMKLPPVPSETSMAAEAAE